MGVGKANLAGGGCPSPVPLPPARPPIPPHKCHITPPLPLSRPFVAMSVPESPAQFVEDTHKKGERVVVNHGTKKIRGEKVAPFQADIVAVLKNAVIAGETVEVAYTVKRCDIPRRTSVVAHTNVFKIKQYESTPVSGEARVSIKHSSATTKKRLQKSLKAEVTSRQRCDDRRLMREEIYQREAALNATWERRAKKFSRAIRVREEGFSAVKMRYKLEVEALEKKLMRSDRAVRSAQKVSGDIAEQCSALHERISKVRAACYIHIYITNIEGEGGREGGRGEKKKSSLLSCRRPKNCAPSCPLSSSCPLSPPLSLSLLCVCIYIYTHTYTHMCVCACNSPLLHYVYIYIHVYI